MKLLCRWARISGCWRSNVELDVDQNGVIRAVESRGQFTDMAWNTRGTTNVGDSGCLLNGAVLPALVNVHSHAFQWGFAGLSEFRTQERDSFWTWRKQMFEYLEQLGPDEMYQVALDLYTRMKASGYACVGEFHYVHSSPELAAYQPVGLLGDVLVQAALDAGISICLLPTLYQRGGFDGSVLQNGQRRFYLSENDFLSVLEAALVRWGDHPRVQIGMALHSLRAVEISVARRVVERFRAWLPHGVIHMHVAEQTKEVEDCLQATGRRPVEFLLDQLPVDRQWCLIHATHMTSAECDRVAQRGAIVGLCPTTEANLGDGIFPAENFLLHARGQIAIGGDSHVAIEPATEMRQLETSQRLATFRRAVLCTTGLSCGEYLFDAVASGGAAATGFAGGDIAIGKRADLIVLEGGDYAPGRLLDRFIFCSPSAVRSRVLIGGQPS